MRSFWEERWYECVFRSFIVKERGEREERERKGKEGNGREDPELGYRSREGIKQSVRE